MTGSHRPLRIVVAETAPGSAAEEVARDLRDGGVEIVYVAAHDGAAELAATAVQEDADGLVVPGAPPAAVDGIRAELDRRGAAEVAVLGGDVSAHQIVTSVRDGAERAP